MRALAITFVAALMAAALWPAVEAAAEMPAARVKVDPVRNEPLNQTVPVLGRLVARQSGVIAARSEGPVAEVRVEVGERVAKGAVLAVLVKDSLQARLDLRQAELTLAQQEVRRLERLRTRKSAAFARARYDDALQNAAKAKANLWLAGIVLNDAEIKAPFPGVVTVRHTEAGAFLKLGAPVVTLVNDGEMEIEADVPASRVAGLTPGREVSAVLDDGTRIKAHVRTVVPEENPMTRTRAVRLIPDFGAGIGGLAVNQSITVHVPVGEAREVVSVHKDAVVFRQGKSLVFVVANGAVQIRPVRLGAAVGARFEVVGGLAPGDLVVTRGNERLRPGQKVRYERGS